VVYEKAYSLLTWSDKVASSILFTTLAVVAILLFFFGLPLLIVVAGLYLLRPPMWRDPLPTPPEAFFGRLPVPMFLSRQVSVIMKQGVIIVDPSSLLAWCETKSPSGGVLVEKRLARAISHTHAS